MPFVTVEGIDGAGKSSVVDALSEEFTDTFKTRYPSADREKGAIIRQGLEEDHNCDRPSSRTDREELLLAFLFLADHQDQYNNEISPALDDGKLVISDRYIESLYATQGVTLAERFDDAVHVLQELAAEAPTEPADLTLWIDVPVDVAVTRLDDETDRYETPAMLKKKRAIYKRLARESPRFVVLDGTQDAVKVAEDACLAVEQHIL